MVEGNDFVAVLFFSTAEDRNEFVKIACSAVPSIHAHALNHGVLVKLNHEHDH